MTNCNIILDIDIEFPRKCASWPLEFDIEFPRIRPSCPSPPFSLRSVANSACKRVTSWTLRSIEAACSFACGISRKSIHSVELYSKERAPFNQLLERAPDANQVPFPSIEQMGPLSREPKYYQNTVEAGNIIHLT